MVAPSMCRTSSIIVLLGLLCLPNRAAALDTLRVGINGNISWTGEVINSNVLPIIPEYVVTKDFTEEGNTPGNLISLDNMEQVAPFILVKTAADVAPEILGDHLNLVNQMIIDAITPIEGIIQIEPTIQGVVSLVLIRLQPEVDFNLALQQIGKAIDPIRPELTEEEIIDGDGGDENLNCTEEDRIFESTVAVTEEWGDCDTVFLPGGISTRKEQCWRVNCRDRTTGQQTQRPGRLTGKRVAKTSNTLQEDEDQEGQEEVVRLPLGTSNPFVLPVSLGPANVARGENVAHLSPNWNGRITAPAIQDVASADLEAALFELIQPDGAEDAFQRKGILGALGTFIVLDLGSPVGINRVRFYPRNTVQNAPQYPFQNDFLRQYEFLVHDGQNLVLDGVGRLVPQLDDYKVLKRDTSNEEAIVDIPIRPPRLVRFLRLKSISSFPYEIDEFEVFGQGFLAQSRYISHVYDLGGPGTWGNISWKERLVSLTQQANASGAQLLIRTRSGNDATPLLYKRRNVERVSDTQQFTSLVNIGEQLERDEYLNLVPNLEANPPKVWEKGDIEEDLVNWSPWSAPYTNNNSPILSPGPRRYIQFSVEFVNSSINATKMLDQLSLEFLTPPIADDLVAEIYPREVEAFDVIDFVYAVRALMSIEGVKGFDTFSIATPTQVLGIDKIQVIGGADETILAESELGLEVVTGTDGQPAVQLADGSVQSLPYTTVSAAGDTFVVEEITPRNFVVKFPQISRSDDGDDRLLKVFFRNRVLLFSTLYDGRASLSTEVGSVQRITSGNATVLGEDDLSTASGITVLSPSITRGSLVGSLNAAPNPFTPNGDGINDRLQVEFDVLAITSEADVNVQVYDLSGRLISNLYQGQTLSGHYDLNAIPSLGWDGRDSGGGIVPPGIYLLRVSVEGDARDSQRLRTIAVAY